MFSLSKPVWNQMRLLNVCYFKWSFLLQVCCSGRFYSYIRYVLAHLVLDNKTKSFLSHLPPPPYHCSAIIRYHGSRTTSSMRLLFSSQSLNLAAAASSSVPSQSCTTTEIITRPSRRRRCSRPPSSALRESTPTVKKTARQKIIWCPFFRTGAQK